jgi:hypothetical protein
VKPFACLLAGSGTPGFADGGVATASFHHPNNLAFDAQGALIVVDRLNFALRRITIPGLLLPAALSTTASSGADSASSTPSTTPTSATSIASTTSSHATTTATTATANTTSTATATAAAAPATSQLPIFTSTMLGDGEPTDFPEDGAVAVGQRKVLLLGPTAVAVHPITGAAVFCDGDLYVGGAISAVWCLLVASAETCGCIGWWDD